MKKTGTSFSTAIISGLMALLVARRRKTCPNAKAKDVEKELFDMCIDIGDIGFDKDTGHGFPFKGLLPKTFSTSYIGLSLRCVFAIIKDITKKALSALTPRRLKKYG